ncbi:MAG TPA: DnaA/Hda family protein [Alphaproteobacteria bacterium]|nr:DnaA/Hda family protein [Alphaproteobacteria bacterium]
MNAAQLPLDLGHRPAMEAEDFLVADSNAEAVGWLDRWPGWPAPALAIHGPPGCGKTHLTRVWQVRSRAVAVTAAALADADLTSLLAATGAVAIDDADQLAGAAAERALFHLYNMARDEGGHLLLTGRTPPARWKIDLPDLASRLKAAPAVAVEEPDDALLSAVLVKLFADRQLRIGAEVIAFAVPRMERSFAAARRLVAEIDATSLAHRRPVTVHLTRAVLDQGIEKEG